MSEIALNCPHCNRTLNKINNSYFECQICKKVYFKQDLLATYICNICIVPYIDYKMFKNTPIFKCPNCGIQVIKDMLIKDTKLKQKNMGDFF